MNDDYSKMRDVVRSYSDSAASIATFLSESENAIPVKMREIADIASLDAAIEWAAAKQNWNMYHGERFGMINPKIPTCMRINPQITRGQVVLFDDVCEKTVSLAVPYRQDVIASCRRAGRYIIDTVIVNFPKEYLIEIVQ